MIFILTLDVQSEEVVEKSKLIKPTVVRADDQQKNPPIITEPITETE
jgi:hypothetical protein